MSQRDDLITILERSHAKMLLQLDQIEVKHKIYPLWTIREMLAHLSGWDDAAIAFVRSLMAGQTPAIPAARGIDFYNAETVSTREGLDYDHIYREYIETRKILIQLLREISAEKITTQYTLPWGGSGTLVDIVNIFGPHEEEHAEDVEKIIAQSQGAG